jgi:uncharacterized membrane protein YfcA
VFRSVFLIGMRLDKKGFIGTSAFIEMFVDIGRLIIYSLSFKYLLTEIKGFLLGWAIGGALFGICLGMILLRRITIGLIQKVIACLLYFLGVLLIVGMIQ